MTNLFAIVDLKKNCLLDFGVATEVKYAEIFAFKSSDPVKRQEICSTAKLADRNSKEIKLYQKPYLLNVDDALTILKARYGSNFIAVENGEFKIQDW